MSDPTEIRSAGDRVRYWLFRFGERIRELRGNGEGGGLDYPEVHHRSSGVRYVKARELLDSGAAQRELDQMEDALNELNKPKSSSEQGSEESTTG
jgi:hypothetical protein